MNRKEMLHNLGGCATKLWSDFIKKKLNIDLAIVVCDKIQNA